MEEIIKIQNNGGKKAVSARELHLFLESKQEFTNWIKNRIDKYDLVENVDYQVFDNFIKNPKGGRPLTEYALTVDAAKELSMVEGNEKGKQARRYFIECEKVAQQSVKSLSPAEALLKSVQMLVEQDKRINQVENKVLEIDARTTTRPEYFTVAGYCRWKKQQASTQMCITIGRKAAKICKQRSIPIDEVPDTRWGKVGSYPASVLEEVFNMRIN